jgi:mevalonate kinase
MVKQKQYCALAPAKLILAGEHSVVYGCNAIVATIDLFTKVTVKPTKERIFSIRSDKFGTSQMSISHTCKKPRDFRPLFHILGEIFEKTEARGGVDVHITSQIPPASGLGSSASVFVALTSALFKMLGTEMNSFDIFRTSMLGEKMSHVNPSGVDIWAITTGGVMKYRIGRKPLPIPTSTEFPIVIAFSGRSRNTGMMVERFRRSLSQIAVGGKEILELLNDVALREGEMLEKGDIRGVGELMTLNHFILSSLGMSNRILDQLVWLSLQCGAFGAKLTGAGGGGAMIGLFAKSELTSVQNLLKQAGITTLKVKLIGDGVRTWEE